MGAFTDTPMDFERDNATGQLKLELKPAPYDLRSYVQSFLPNLPGPKLRHESVRSIEVHNGP